MTTHKFAKIKGLISIVLLMTITWNCENVKEWTDPTDNIPPGKVTAVEVVNLHGGARITYQLPSDDDLLGVKAVYSYRENELEHEVFSSAHMDTIFLSGFPDTNERIVNLYTIDLSRNLSEPVLVTIQPLTPPVELVRQSLKINETFGGVYCSWENTMEENIAVSLYVESDGEMTLDDTYFSKSSKGGYSFRGFENEEYSFRVEIRDRWQNYAMPLDTILIPMYEEQIFGRDPSTGTVFWTLWGYPNRECLSRGDAWLSASAADNFTLIYDGILNNFWSTGNDWGFLNAYVNGAPNTLMWPTYYSFDLGRTAVFSRMKKYVRDWTGLGTSLGQTRHIYEFEVWGTNNPKPLIPEVTAEDRLTNLRYWTSWAEVEGTDEWKNDWVMLADVSLRCPSGAILFSDMFTAEDEEYIRNGFEIEFDPDKTTVPCRYIRFVFKTNARTDTWMDQNAEFQFFGALVN